MTFPRPSSISRSRVRGQWPRVSGSASLFVLGTFLCSLGLGACDEPKKSETTSTVTTASAPPIADKLEKPIGSVSQTNTAPEPVKTKEPVTCAPASEPVAFHMPGLEAEIRKKLAKPEGPIAAADLSKVKSVNLTGTPVNELDPCVFPQLKGMKDLFLGKGELSDLAPLSTLTGLISLRATDNEVVDASPLAKMTKMDRLDISKSKVRDIGFIGSMTELTELAIDGTEVSDLSPLAKCTKLEKLSAKGTRVKDVTALAGLKKLKNLWLEGSPTNDTAALAPLVARGLKITF